jgi:hypothetical protein
MHIFRMSDGTLVALLGFRYWVSFDRGHTWDRGHTLGEA